MTTPCEKMGLKVGDRVRFADNDDCDYPGQIGTLIEDDGSDLPFFWVPGDDPFCEYLKFCTKLPAEPNPGDGYARIDHDDGRIEFVPVARYGVDWHPGKGEEYFWISGAIEIIQEVSAGTVPDEVLIKIHNAYPTKEHAERAAELLREAYREVWVKVMGGQC